ncbi:chorismate mutase [Testudinibacter aquarius]|uniref:Bifunctional chorismate mutase/prephenate dehydratase n=1 Tax=Testudinibacter aquarius TaxID=1524974 RepID=A0A4R3YD85_9PAST|nr:chorismate mutase [Testudinibacter aquarius]KAE9527467.1 bifunctional chorismate mutase/prephenate dehydratase [Testudinibacter aquarius]TCV89996.1 chorismate mutase [Testudinibacter aquarius]TNG93032.1 chorismate mutase [Testudinibacter aquarius]
MPKDLNEIRQQITQLDRHLLKLLSERHRLAYDVARSKELSKKPLRDTGREQQLLQELIHFAEAQNYPLEAQYITQIFQKIIEDSVLTQQAYLQNKLNQQRENSTSIAFLGVRGSYSNLAARQYAERYKKQLVELSSDSFQQIFDKVESGEADYGILPLENTTSGAINDVYDLLQHTQLSIVGELTYPIKHCVLVAGDTALEQIDTLYSHPQVIAQCSRFIQQLERVHINYCESSSHAMQLVSQLNTPNIAALGNADGGKLYGLRVLKTEIANQANNITRFIVIAKNAITVSPQLQTKTLLLMSTPQTAGSLVDALLVFKNHHIQMSKLESRPIYGRPWEEMFYLEIEANIHDPQTQTALEELKQVSTYLKILGCYPSEIVQPVDPA